MWLREGLREAMSVERDALICLVQHLSEGQVRQVLADVRRMRGIGDREWPPAFFASAPGDGKSVAEEADELLREGFGR
jgi:hypothetical protein